LLATSPNTRLLGVRELPVVKAVHNGVFGLFPMRRGVAR